MRNVLGAEPDDWQVEVMESVATGSRRISIRSGHGVGKSTACAWTMLWFMTTRYPQKTVCTAPTAAQLFDALFNELKFWLSRLPPFIRDLFEATSDRVVLKAQPEASFVSARTASKERPEALQGVHSENVLFLCDEASGIDEAVFEASVGAMSGDNACWIMIGNPTRSSGLFYKTHHELAHAWKRFHVPSVTLEGVRHPRVAQDFIDQIRDTYGEGSNAFRVRVLGEFPLADDDTLIPAELVDAAMVRDVVEDSDAPIVYGVDPARFGDDASVLVKRRGDVVLGIKRWHALDLMSLVGQIVHEAGQDNPVEINVDSIGLGAGVADRLRELGLPVRDVNVAEVAAMNVRCDRLRDDLWVQMKDWLSSRACRLPRDELLRTDLITPKYGFRSNGKMFLESKADMKKRLRRSPDSGDALAATFAGQGALVGGRVSGWSTGKSLRRDLSLV